MERGLLDLSVQLSTRSITAGNEFALFVLATNPFDKPVWIREVNVSLPSELKLAHEREAQEKFKEEQDRHDTFSRAEEQRLTEIRTELENLLQQLKKLVAHSPEEQNDELVRLRRAIEEKWDILGKQKNASVHIHGGAEVGVVRLDSNDASVHIFSEKEDKQVTRVGRLEFYDPQVEAGLLLSRTVKLKSSLPPGSALQPGSTVVYTIVLNVKKSLIFTPTQYRLQFNVNYSFSQEIPRNIEVAIEGADQVLTNTIAHELAIRPSVYSLIIGAMLGGFIGSSAKLLQTTPSESWQTLTGVNLISSLVTIAVAVILSGMAIIFMARKSDAQSFVSIEDFWGGLLIGFLVGYTGTSFFESLTGVPALTK